MPLLRNVVKLYLGNMFIHVYNGLCIPVSLAINLFTLLSNFMVNKCQYIHDILNFTLQRRTQ